MEQQILMKHQRMDQVWASSDSVTKLSTFLSTLQTRIKGHWAGDVEGIRAEGANNLSLIAACDHQLVVSLVVVEKTTLKCELNHENLDVVNVGFCDVNKVDLNDSSSGLVIVLGGYHLDEMTIT
ncbi:hypothetical protein KFK09_016715 [Dendrobium nobile]|uniref:Uncharacterized protein n=1 Tax=Dendrobium nobile TaxID=94219 RepID=A0A8T3B0A2_DENNO|nr:hypothetical protein KFK09_016715 [Dendrobium nobile]